MAIFTISIFTNPIQLFIIYIECVGRFVRKGDSTIHTISFNHYVNIKKWGNKIQKKEREADMLEDKIECWYGKSGKKILMFLIGTH